MRNNDLEQLLTLITRQQKTEVSKENIFDRSVQVYLTMKTMYQNYKNSHELQIMQARIFQIDLPTNIQLKSIQSTQVRASALFDYHHMSQSDLLLLIQMKDYLNQNAKVELYQEILKGIQQQEKASQYMNCYRTLLNRQFVNQNMELYQVIEEKMIRKLMTLESIRGKEARVISHKLAGLPVIKQSIRVLISQLYEKVVNIKDFRSLYLIFEANFPENPDQLDIQALFRICLPQTLIKISQLFEKRPDLRPTLMEAMEKSVKNMLNTMDLIKTSKTMHILNLVVQAVKLGIPIWHQIIEWQHKATQQPKNMLKNSLQGILIAMLRQFRCFPTVVAIIERITDIDQHSQIGLIFVRQLLKLQSKQYLSHRVIRRFLAIKILKYNSSEDFTLILFNRSFKFIEVILQMFKHKSNVINFYQNMLNSQEKFNILDTYLGDLVEKIPLKFKQFFIRIVESDLQKNELFTNGSSPMLRLLSQKLTPQISAIMVKDLSTSKPSKSLLIILGKMMTMFKDKPLLLLKANYVRALNILLVRTQKSQISKTFQIQFPSFIKEHLIKESNEIFVNVPEETKEELKKTYESYLLRKKPL